MFFKSREQKEKERLELIESVLQDMIEDGEVYRDENGNYGLTDYGLCIAEQKMRMGWLARQIDLLKMTWMYMHRGERKRGKDGVDEKSGDKK
ncbi:hypothetical protein Mtc_1516 [Methanocella conradii HZ254]|uniref:Uncharacterized protein n=1 Tax=Methanocella conradii (strain DSM 24694 / JCM 17849 / CGMCC 1.5162 / HZ254) TaxID=1041930 RepID=H8I635_METCZ|nr:hypothetical protein [Methanocella conradii]AFD00269.1 hypothetical protein Mtc_1516 [Methanocella conradii HZ254]MDI6895925.1 hypothetical protein [Methanocella conradii]